MLLSVRQVIKVGVLVVVVARVVLERRRTGIDPIHQVVEVGAGD